jgi:hypothetical protein
LEAYICGTIYNLAVITQLEQINDKRENEEHICIDKYDELGNAGEKTGFGLKNLRHLIIF